MLFFLQIAWLFILFSLNNFLWWTTAPCEGSGHHCLGEYFSFQHRTVVCCVCMFGEKSQMNEVILLTDDTATKTSRILWWKAAAQTWSSWRWTEVKLVFHWSYVYKKKNVNLDCNAGSLETKICKFGGIYLELKVCQAEKYIVRKMSCFFQDKAKPFCAYNYHRRCLTDVCLHRQNVSQHFKP